LATTEFSIPIADDLLVQIPLQFKYFKTPYLQYYPEILVSDADRKSKYIEKNIAGFVRF